MDRQNLGSEAHDNSTLTVTTPGLNPEATEFVPGKSMLADALFKRARADNGNATYVEDGNKKCRTDYFDITGSGEPKSDAARTAEHVEESSPKFDDADETRGGESSRELFGSSFFKGDFDEADGDDWQEDDWHSDMADDGIED